MSTDDVRLMEAAVNAEPECRAALAALTDAYMEAGDDNVTARAKAIYHAAGALNARDMAAAAKFIADKGEHYEEFVAMLADYVGVMNESRFSLLLADGSAPPTVRYAQNTAASGWWYFATITVGAGWVVAWIMKQETLAEFGREVKKRRRAPKRQR